MSPEPLREQTVRGRRCETLCVWLRVYLCVCVCETVSVIVCEVVSVVVFVRLSVRL